MRYWLFKSEPGAWSWEDHVRAGTAEWDGVRNYQADNNMKAMRVGDRGFFYHSVNPREIVGIVEIVREHYPDSTDPKGRFGMVDLKALMPVAAPVSLAAIKAEPALAGMALIRQSRLSVLPVGAEEWSILCRMAGIRA